MIVCGPLQPVSFFEAETNSREIIIIRIQPISFCFRSVRLEFYNPHSITVCRGQMRSIACPNLELIHIFNAFYGKLNGQDCDTPVGSQKRDNIPTCIARNSPGIIKDMCHGQQSCDLYAEDALYEDPCPGATKYLFVSFTCQGKSQLKQKLQELVTPVRNFFPNPQRMTTSLDNLHMLQQRDSKLLFSFLGYFFKV